MPESAWARGFRNAWIEVQDRKPHVPVADAARAFGLKLTDCRALLARAADAGILEYVPEADGYRLPL